MNKTSYPIRIKHPKGELRLSGYMARGLSNLLEQRLDARLDALKQFPDIRLLDACEHAGRNLVRALRGPEPKDQP